MSVFRCQFERMLRIHEKKSSNAEADSIPVEEATESANYESETEDASDSRNDEVSDSQSDVEESESESDIDEDKEDSETVESSEDDSDYSDDDDSDSGSEASEAYVENIISQMNSDRKPPLKTDSSDKNSGLFLSLEMVQMLRASTSESDLFANEKATILSKMAPRRNSGDSSDHKTKTGIVYCLQSKSPLVPTEISVHPKEYLLPILNEKNFSDCTLKWDNVGSFYVREENNGYTTGLMTAVRQDNLKAIQEMYENGANLQCCNQFGESIVHTVARRGRSHILQYLVNVAGVTINVCCDTGRNPLHDACWTANPCFDCISFILETCPDLLWIADKRGFTPLDYAPKDSYQRWCTYIEANRDMFITNFSNRINK